MLKEEFLKNVAENKVDAETIRYARECLDKMVPVGEELFGAYAQKIIEREAKESEVED